MSKYKVGDVVRRTGEDCANVRKGMTYTVSGLSDAGDTLYLGFGDKGYCSYNFELVQDESEYLTTEQVLQYFKEGRQDELEYIKPNGVTLNNMTEYTGLKYLFEGEWRVKSVPKTIDYYGTELPKPITKAEAIKDYDFVYRPQLNGDTTYERVSVLSMVDDNLNFKSCIDAIRVRKVILKPFNQ